MDPRDEQGEPFAGLDSIPDLSRTMELVERARSGDRQSLSELLELYRPRLERIIRVRMGARLQRHLDEADIVQEVFLVVLDKIGAAELRDRAGILHWLARIAEHEISEHLAFHSALKRDSSREVHLALESPGTADRHGVRVATPDPSPSQRALRAELEQLVDSYVEALEPPEYRDVILLRDYYGEEWEAIGKELGRPTVPAAQELYRRAHRKLRERMRKHLES